MLEQSNDQFLEQLLLCFCYQVVVATWTCCQTAFDTWFFTELFLTIGLLSTPFLPLPCSELGRKVPEGVKLISNLFFQNYQLMVLMDGLFLNGNVV